ncbi:hypothetical protein AALI21_02945 [Corynebacteriaceae bacterium 6-324]
MIDNPDDFSNADIEEIKDGGKQGQPQAEKYINVSTDRAAEIDVPRNREAERAAQGVKSFPQQNFLQDADKGMSSPLFLTGLANWHPGLGSFQYLADCLNPKDMPHDKRLEKTIDKHPVLYRICLGIDAIVMILVLLGLASIALLTIYRTFGLDFINWL